VTLLGMNTWLGPEMGGNGVEERPGMMEVAVAGEVTRVDGCNVIPAQKAGIIAELAQVTGGCGFAPVHPDHTKSRMDDINRLSFLTVVAYSLRVVERTVAMSLAKTFQASQHRATMSAQVSKTATARRSARRQAWTVSTGSGSGALGRAAGG
jgi:hypothetical protein